MQNSRIFVNSTSMWSVCSPRCLLESVLFNDANLRANEDMDSKRDSIESSDSESFLHVPKVYVTAIVIIDAEGKTIVAPSPAIETAPFMRNIYTYRSIAVL